MIDSNLRDIGFGHKMNGLAQFDNEITHSFSFLSDTTKISTPRSVYKEQTAAVKKTGSIPVPGSIKNKKRYV